MSGNKNDGSVVSKQEIWEDPEAYDNYYKKAVEYWEVHI